MRPNVLLATAVVLGATALPAAAAPFCAGGTGSAGVHFGLGFQFGEFSESERNDFDLMNLRRMGVDATRVERWNGCLRAFVRNPAGGETMEFYDPNTYRRVY